MGNIAGNGAPGGGVRCLAGDRFTGTRFNGQKTIKPWEPYHSLRRSPAFFWCFGKRCGVGIPGSTTNAAMCAMTDRLHPRKCHHFISVDSSASLLRVLPELNPAASSAGTDRLKTRPGRAGIQPSQQRTGTNNASDTLQLALPGSEQFC